ncbi:hypothetical protein ONE63_011259 [Megalurothrips usitatus]|uniref:Peroxidase n=1 Tax=Megalurothrips usitatus TaxID=439358 RepID=A0AAV7X310_9NEOP|nr:hypothetical protein ONE63_011259 [Megalurothrips usitatus]
MATERTPLRTGPPSGPGAYDQAAPTYVFMTNPGRAHRNKIRQFQCCVCAAILGIFVMALVITISYSVEHDDIDNNRTTPEPPTTTTALPPANGTLQLLLGSSWPKPDAAPPPWPGPQPDEAALQRAVAQGREQLAARATLEATMTPLQRDTPAYRANQAVHTRPEATAMAQRALLEEEATKQLLSGSAPQLSATAAAGRGPRLRSAAADAGSEDAACADDGLPLPCPSTPYRSADGTCNNVDHPRSWGVAMRPFRRALPPAYLDGVSEPRGVLQGLPSAREVSLGVHRPLYRNDPDFTVMLAVWGQFIDHDITATALSQAADGSAISCCDVDPAQQHPECFPVRLAPGDPYYHKYNVTCMEFVRSAPAPTCSLGQREQLNQASSYLDASVVYGPSSELMKSLREDPTHLTEDRDGNAAVRSSAGRLKMTLSPDGRELLPVSEDPADGCNRQEMNDRGRYCFKSGDGRANENLHLTTMHLLLARQHNRLAASLQSMNPQWSDERVFQEARRIVAAQMQHVTYNEFLPVILGPRMMEQMDLNPKAAGYDTSYDPAVDATIANSFAASSFRFAHTLLPGLLKLIGNDTSSPEYVELHQMLFDPYSLYSREGADRALRGAMDTSVEKADNYFNAEVTTKLFAPRSIGRGSSGQPACGLDLVSLNVQRGRDHGLQPYPAWREHCGFPRPASWEDLGGVVDQESLQRMKQIYKSVDDVDVYTGALSEYPVETGLLGGTLTCLLGDQFVRLKRGDRFWYETDQQPQAFTPAQLAEIRKTSLASIICSTSDGVHSAQPRVMRRAQGGANKRVPCAQLPRTNLRAWVERDGRYVVQRADALAATGHEPRHQDNVPDDLVLVGAASSADTAGLTATAARAVRVGARVTSGSVTTSSGASLWSGALPAPIPTRSSGTFLAGGVAWEGSIVASGSTASLRGTFAVDAFSPAAGAAPQPGQRVEGRFDIDLDVLWDSSSDGNIDLSGSFRSPVYLRAGDGQHDGPLVSPKGEGGPLAPVILHGRHDADGTFLWDGNVTLVLPTLAEDSVLDDDDLSSAYSSGPAVAPSSSQVRIVAEVLSGSVTAQGDGGAPVTWWGGSLPTDISTSPFDAHSADVSPAGASVSLVKPSARLDGVLWTATVAASSPTTAQVSGTFKAPRFVHGNFSGAGVQVEWWSGSFALNLRLLGRVDDEVEGGLEALLAPNQQYTSRLLFQADSPSHADPAAEPRAPLELMAAAQEVADGAVPAPVILKGAFSADGKSFSWSGKATLVLPRPAGAPPSPAVQMLGQKRAPHWARPRPRLLAPPPPSGPRLVATVKSGTVKAGPQGQPATTVWSGSFPAAIPMPLLDSVRSSDTQSAAAEAGDSAPLYAHGLIWKGRLSTSATTAILVGTFSAPRFLHAPRADNATGFAIEWWEGSFALELDPTWTGSLDGAVDSSATYSSPVYFKGVSKAGADASPGQAGQRTPLSAFVAASLEQSEGALRAPLILQGAYSADRSLFLWSGALVLALPRPAPPPPATPPLPPLQAAPAGAKTEVKKADATKPGKPAKPAQPPKLRLMGTVVGGSVNATYDNSTETEIWSGGVPMWLPNPLSGLSSWDLDSTIKWSGTLTTLDKTGKLVQLDGEFSAPYYEQGADGVIEHEWKGTFSVQLRNMYTSVTHPELLKSSVKYTSKVVFVPPKAAAGSASDTAPQLLLTDSQGQNLAVIVLQGQYWFWSKSWFWWNGVASVAVPLDDDSGVNPNAYAKPDKQMAVTRVMASAGSASTGTTKVAVAVVEASASFTKIGAVVTSGTVTAAEAGGVPASVWTGTLPASLPSGGSGPASILWSGSLKQSSPTSATLSGTFTTALPGADANATLAWWSGDFTLQLQLLWNASVANCIRPGVKYVTPLYYRSAKQQQSLPQRVASLGQELASGGQQILAFLDGDYSADKTSFLWSGKVFLSLPKGCVAFPSPAPAPAPAPLTLKASAAGGAAGGAGRVAVGAVVASGWVTPSLWSGSLPVAVPVAAVRSLRPLSWTGTLARGSAGTVSVKGKYAAPQYSHDGGVLAVDWIGGDFSFTARTLWDTGATLDGALTGTANYTSVIHLQNSDPLRALEDVQARVPAVWDRMMDGASSPSEITATAKKVPIVLQGEFAPGGATFMWSGGVLIGLPAAA